MTFNTNYHGIAEDLYDKDGHNQPGPSYWNPANAFIGTDGFLHLKYTNNAVQKTAPPNSWASAEAQLLTPINYGDFFFTVQFLTPPGAGAYDALHDWNTTFGAYTFATPNPPLPAGLCGSNCWESTSNPNACHEIDMVEWGKSRDKNNVGMAQWGTQPWFNNSCSFNKINLSRDGWDFKQQDWDALGAANQNITFRLNWTKNPPNLEFWASPGDFGPTPWNGGFLDNPRWHFKYSGPVENIPIVDGNTYLMFNLWAPGVPPQVGPADNKTKEIIIKNIAVPSPGIPRIK